MQGSTIRWRGDDREEQGGASEVLSCGGRWPEQSATAVAAAAAAENGLGRGPELFGKEAGGDKVEVEGLI
jgi:hypothetical protein